MQIDSKALDLSLKYSFIGVLIYAISAFMFSTMYEITALGALHLDSSSGDWPEIWALGGFSPDKILRWFLFFFLMFLVLTWVSKSSLNQSPFSSVLLFLIIPAFAGVIPRLISQGIFAGNIFWSLAAYLLVLRFLGVGFRSGSTPQRLFYVSLIVVILFSKIYSVENLWVEEIRRMTVKYGGRGGEPAFARYLVIALPQAVVTYYLIAILPAKFFAKLKEV